jgi:23S rRNA (adenine1618-N6)-methyltransferase
MDKNKIIKTELHPKNKHNSNYDFDILIKHEPSLIPFVLPNKYGNLSIDFFNPDAVKSLNTALLKTFYNIQYWEIPDGYLCPPIPGRADYIHHIAEFLDSQTKGSVLKNCIDIGTGANCVYPIIAVSEYNWNVLGTEIDNVALENAKKIIDNNPILQGKVQLKLQQNQQYIFKGIVESDMQYDICICNPPFHESAADAHQSSIRKLSNLKKMKVSNPILNFGGQSNELWCKGGEVAFITRMIHESKEFADNISWFSTLVSKEKSLTILVPILKSVKPKTIKILEMGQGNKISRILVWGF